MKACTLMLWASLVGACAGRSANVASPAPVAACELAGAPEVIAVEGPVDGEVHEMFDLPDLPQWWAPAPMDAARSAYRAALVVRLGEAGILPEALLRRQLTAHAGATGNLAREAENGNALLHDKAGKIGPASCLEWRLFDRQHGRFPMLTRPTEISAYVLRGAGRLHVYLSGADRVGGRLRGEVTDRVLADVAAGFEVVAHLHNHPFMFDRAVGDRTWATAENIADIGGALAPSLTDVQLYRAMRERLGLRGAWVTNGLDTARYTAADFDRLSAWPPTP